MKFTSGKFIGIVLTVIIIVGAIVGVTLFYVLRANGDNVSFPKDFKFGAASASYQIEGAWNEDGKSPNVWDTTTHKNPGYILDWTNGDVAADSYHMYRKDIAALTNVGVRIDETYLSNKVTDHMLPSV